MSTRISSTLRYALLLCLATCFASNEALAQAILVKGTLKGATGYTVALLYKDGSSATKKLTANGAFSFSKVKLRNLAGATVQLIAPDGRYFGPVVLGKKNRKVSISLSGKNVDSGAVLNLGRLTLRSGYASAAPGLSPVVYTTPRVAADSTGKPSGAGSLGVVQGGAGSALQSSGRVYATNATNPGDDTDADGIINAVDADDNGNGILDSADPASAGTDTPYVGIYFDFASTLNAWVRSGLSNSAIDALVSGENIFASTFFISLPETSPVDGGYIVCGDALSYCRPNTPLGYSGGVSESSDRYRAPLSSLLNSRGYPSLERIFVGGRPAIVLSMQPRVGRDGFRAGDLYRVVLTSGSREVSSRTFALPPYFISIPAIKEYTANGVTTVVDYNSLTPTSGDIPGRSPGNPIVLGSDGLLRLSLWRPQREPLGSETGYQDFGGLNYGVIVDQLQATCSGFFSNVTSELVERSDALGNGGSPFSHQGARLHPLVDQVPDRPANISNTLSFTVDLKSCLARAGGAPGTHRVSLTAAGIDLTGGANAGTQGFYVAIP
jgi:hypothetical protein